MDEDSPMSGTYEEARLKAMAQGHSGNYGSATGMTRDSWPADSRSRTRCHCCGKRATHVGGAGALALMMGCELTVRRWVRDGYAGGESR